MISSASRGRGARIPRCFPGHLLTRFLIAGALPAALSGSAQAHVKWFAPYIVGAPPRPVSETLTNSWFWLAIVLVVVFLLATRAVERTATGETVLQGLDRLSGPLWRRADDFLRVTIGAFFVAVFAVGGVYLTPDLKTPSEWVSWAQLLIAAGTFYEAIQCDRPVLSGKGSADARGHPITGRGRTIR